MKRKQEKKKARKGGLKGKRERKKENIIKEKDAKIMTDQIRNIKRMK